LILVLASASPRRQELLRRICSEFEIVPSGIEETLTDEAPAAAVVGLALRKARAVAERCRDRIVLAADTIVVIDCAVFGKPADGGEARDMLRRLRGREHEVITGVAVVDAQSARAASTAVTTRVVMADYSDVAIDAYLATGRSLDKAGAYAIQDLGPDWIVGVVGSYTNVIGLPIEPTRRLLEMFGVPVNRDAPS